MEGGAAWLHSIGGRPLGGRVPVSGSAETGRHRPYFFDASGQPGSDDEDVAARGCGSPVRRATAVATSVIVAVV